MKGQIESVAVRSAAAVAALLPIAAIAGGWLNNHNETLLRDGGASDADPQEPALRHKIGSVAVRSTAAIAALLPIAAIAGGWLNNHNETLLRDPQS